MRPAIINLDLDFFIKPAYIGNNYFTQDFYSYSDFKAKAKRDIKTKDFIRKIQLKKTRGMFVADDKQLLFNIKKLLDEKYLEAGKFTLIHIDAHSDMYDFFGWDYYDAMKTHEYMPFNSLISVIKNKWVQSPIYWVYPDYLDETPELLDTSGIKFDIKKIKWSHFNQTIYDYKYINVVLNKHMTIEMSDIIDEIKPFVSEW